MSVSGEAGFEPPASPTGLMPGQEAYLSAQYNGTLPSFGPANPSVLSDPSGIGNASRIAPLAPNRPAPPTSYGAVDTPAPRARVVTAPYAGDSQRIISPRQAQSRKPPARKRGRPEMSSFTGICRGC